MKRFLPDTSYQNLKLSCPVSRHHPEISNRFPVFTPELAIRNNIFIGDDGGSIY
jgi:hypothetical protein